jgi:hypothetical protein
MEGISEQRRVPASGRLDLRLTRGGRRISFFLKLEYRNKSSLTVTGPSDRDR